MAGPGPPPGTAPPELDAKPLQGTAARVRALALPFLATGPEEATPSLATWTSLVTSGQQHRPLLPALTLHEQLGLGGGHPRAHSPGGASSTGWPTRASEQPGLTVLAASAALTYWEASGQGGDSLQRPRHLPRCQQRVAGSGLMRPLDRVRDGTGWRQGLSH